MPIQIIWGNDIQSCENEIEKIINSNISKQWESFNLSKLDGNEENQVFKALEEVQNAPFGDRSRIILLKNNPIFNIKNDKFAAKFESSAQNGKAGTTDIKETQSATQVSVGVGGIADGTVTAAFATRTTKSGDADAANRTGMELGWKTSIGATSFEVAYGSWTDDDNGGGDSASDIEIEMKYSF